VRASTLGDPAGTRCRTIYDSRPPENLSSIIGHCCELC